MSITLLISKMSWQICVNPTTNLRNYYDILMVERGDHAEIWFKSPHFRGLIMVEVC